jgi:hypothetical protein
LGNGHREAAGRWLAHMPLWCQPSRSDLALSLCCTHSTRHMSTSVQATMGSRAVTVAAHESGRARVLLTRDGAHQCRADSSLVIRAMQVAGSAPLGTDGSTAHKQDGRVAVVGRVTSGDRARPGSDVSLLTAMSSSTAVLWLRT